MINDVDTASLVLMIASFSILSSVYFSHIPHHMLVFFHSRWLVVSSIPRCQDSSKSGTLNSSTSAGSGIRYASGDQRCIFLFLQFAQWIWGFPKMVVPNNHGF